MSSLKRNDAALLRALLLEHGQQEQGSKRNAERLTNFGATSEQQRPNTIENQAPSGTRRRSQALRITTPLNLQKLHPRSNPGGASKILKKFARLVVFRRVAQ